MIRHNDIAIYCFAFRASTSENTKMVQQRYILAAVLFVSLGVSFALRMTFPLILTQMVYVPNVNNEKNDTTSSNGELICPIEQAEPQDETGNQVLDTGDRYHWSQELQGIILSSYFVGNIFSQIPGGILVQKYGGKWIYLFSTFLSAINIALIPLAVNFGDSGGLIAVLFIAGFLQGPLLPAVASFAAPWFLAEERGRIISIIFMGINIGGILFAYLVGIVMHESKRWDVVFYGLAVVTTITGILFAILCYENPQKHPFISDQEKSLLKQKTRSHLEANRKNLPPIPWKAILTSSPIIALLVSMAFYTWAFTVMATNFPKYLSDVLHIPLKKVSIYTAVPRFIGIIVSIFSGFLSDWMYSKRKISLTKVRKIFVVLASITPAVFAVAGSFANCNEPLVVVLLSISMSGQGFDTAGSVSNAFDLSPNYTGPINAIAFTISSGAALLAPFIVGILTPHAFLSEYRIVFWLTFVFYISKAIIFTIWGSAEVQPWNS